MAVRKPREPAAGVARIRGLPGIGVPKSENGSSIKRREKRQSSAGGLKPVGGVTT